MRTATFHAEAPSAPRPAKRRLVAARLEPPGGAGTIRSVHEDRVTQADEARPRSALRDDRARVEMIAREKRMTVEQRVALFERLSRDAAWIRSSAKRIR